MRRYRSLGLMRSHARRRNDQSRTEVERFVSESQVKDVILYNRLARTRPGIQTLQFASDDVDWQLEYFCEVLGKWLKAVIGWIAWLFQFLINCITRRMRTKRRRSGGGGGDDDDGFEDGFNFPRNLVTRTGSIVRLPVTMNKDANSKVWRFKQCQPLSNRRFLRRKWLLKPETREWAEESLDTFQRHVSRGFRSLCSAVGKDTKIYVVSASPSNAPGPGSSATQIRTTVFLADSSVLKSQSQLFRTWFLQSGDKKEIETSFVTPEEMEAILVYIYTLTWPTSMIQMGGKGDRRRKLNDRFFEVLMIYGISLKLIKEDPFQDDIPGTYEDAFYDSLAHPIFSQSNLHPSCGSGDGQGDFIQFFNEIQDFEHASVTIEGESKASRSSSTSLSQVEDVRNLRSFLRDKFRLHPNASRRIHPETVLPTDERLRLINTLQTNDFVIITHRRHNNNNSSVEELESV